MWPVLFTFRGVTVHSYPVVIYLAFLLMVFFAVALAQKAALDPDRVAWAVLIAYVPGFIAARLMFVARHWEAFRTDKRQILDRSIGGLSLHGGILGFLPAAFFTAKAFGLPAAAFMDALSLAALGGLAVAKVACLLNGCCHGRATANWCGVNLPDHAGRWRRRFPAPPIEMVWALAVLACLLAVRRYDPPPGVLACLVFICHPLGRIGLQSLRDEGGAEDKAVRLSSLVLMAVAGLLLVTGWMSTAGVQ